jgi:hypothetical protein
MGAIPVVRGSGIAPVAGIPLCVGLAQTEVQRAQQNGAGGSADLQGGDLAGRLLFY